MIKMSQSFVGDPELLAVKRVFEGRYLGMGMEVKAFESEIASLIGGNKKVTCTATGTAALHLALQAAGIGPGDEVLVPTITYVASFQAISATGATPVACDVDFDSLCIDPDDARARLTPRTKAIMPVHYAGGYGRLPQIYDIARENGLRVIEDAAHSFGGLYNGKPVGHGGDIICFSFDGIKNITCGEGGAIVTGDDAVTAAAQDLRLLGVHKDTDKRFSGMRSWDFDVTEQGWRYHMNNMAAAMGRAQLTQLDAFKNHRRGILDIYKKQLADIPGIGLLNINYEESFPYIFVICINGGRRDGLAAFLKDHHIETGIHYKPAHLLSKYRGPVLKNAELAYSQMLTLPFHGYLTPGEALTVCQMVKKFLGHK